jgi:HEAT repeat protein
LADPEAVTAALLAASESPDQGLRSSAAFSLGVVSGDGAVERLEVLCNDVNDDVRYNAALGLARLGGTAAWETLTEMLTLPDVAAPPGDDEAQAARYKRAMVVVNALKGVSLLVDDTSQPPPEAITTAIAGLREDDIADVRQGARALLDRIGRLDAEVVPAAL